MNSQTQLYSPHSCRCCQDPDAAKPDYYDWLRVADYFGKLVDFTSHSNEDYGRGLYTLRNVSPALRKILLILDPEKNRMSFVHDGNYTSLRLNPALKDKEVCLALKVLRDSTASRCLSDPSKSVPLRYLYHHDRNYHRTQPPSLKELCRRVIRRECNEDDEMIVHVLPVQMNIPKQILNYLLR